MTIATFYDALKTDLRYGARQLIRAPLFTIIATLSLAVGIGVTVVALNIGYTSYLQPLPVKNPQSLFRVYVSDDRQYDQPYGPSSFDAVSEYQSTGAFKSLAVMAREYFSITGSGIQTTGEAFDVVSSKYFDMLGVQTVRGRTFEADDKREVVLEYRFWQHQFGGDASALGKIMSLNGVDMMIVGVAPEGFEGILGGGRAIAGWVGIRTLKDVLPGRAGAMFKETSNSFDVVARLNPGIAVDAANARLAALSGQLAADNSAVWRDRQKRPRHISVMTEMKSRVVAQGTGRTIFVVAIFTILVLMVLGIACVNVAGLLLARAVARQHEVTVRLTLGATRPRLFAQLFAESGVLAGLGGAAGCLCAFWLMSAMSKTAIFATMHFHLGARTVLFTLLASAGAATLFGLAPILYSMNTDIRTGLGSANSSSVQNQRARSRILIGQMATSITVLLVAAASFQGLRRQVAADPGFDTRGLLIASIPLGRFGGDTIKTWNYTTEIPTILAAVPGVVSAGLSERPPVDPDWRTQPRLMPNGELASGWMEGDVDQGFLTAMKLNIRQGRSFTSSDNASSARVAIINDIYARGYKKGVGDFIDLDEHNRAQVIGIVQNILYHDAGEVQQPFVYVPRSQASKPTYWQVAVVRVRPGNEAAMIRSLGAALAARHPEFATPAFVTMSHYIRSTVDLNRIIAKASVVIGIIELALAAVGMYGILMYALLSRTREIGIRLALGARQVQATWAITKNGLQTCAIGMAVGCLLGLPITMLMSHQMTSVKFADPVPFIIACAAAGAAAIAAALGPVLRGSRIEPAVALRHE